MVDYTTHGFPSAEASDELADVPAIMLELATLLESRVKLFSSGTVSLAMAALDTVYTSTVVFPEAYAAAPHVLGLEAVTALPHLYALSISSISATQLVIAARRTSGSATPLTIHWAVRG